MLSKCPRCGSVKEVGGEFCGNCGNVLPPKRISSVDVERNYGRGTPLFYGAYAWDMYAYYRLGIHI